MLANFKARSLAIFWVVFVALAWGVIVWTIAEGPINSLDIILTLVASPGAYMAAVFGYSWIRGSDFFQGAPSSSKIRDMLENIDLLEARNRMVINVPADPAEAYPPLDSMEDDIEENPRNNEWDEIKELVKEYRNERDH